MFILCLLMFALINVCMLQYTTWVTGAQRGQKRMSDLLELKLQIVMSHHMGARKQSRVLWESSQWSALLTYIISSS